MPNRRQFLTLAAALPLPALAQASYPDRPIRLVVPFPPGGTTDVLARSLAAKWQEAPLNAQVVVDNRAGGGGVVGTDAVARAAPDGYTLVVGNNQTHATNGALVPNLSYDPANFAPITLLALVPHALVVPAGSPARDVAGLVALARASDKGLSYASSSIGSASHLTSATFVKRQGINATHVPYRGAAPAAADLIAGTVDFMMATWASVASLVADGRLRVLAVSGHQRFPDQPAVPTLNELGYDYISSDSWFGLFAPAGTPEGVQQQLYAATERAWADPAIRERLTNAGFQVATMPPAAFGPFQRAEIPRWAVLVRESGVTIRD